MKYKLTINDTDINIDILPGAKFECKIYKGNGLYKLSYGTIMKCNDRLVLMLCGLLFFGYGYNSWNSIHTYNKKFYDYYQNDNNDSMKIKGIVWYLDFEKYPDNFGLSPKLFVVTDVWFNNMHIYESNYMLKCYKPSIKPNYIHKANENCKCFKYCGGDLYSSEKLEDYAEVIPNKKYTYE